MQTRQQSRRKSREPERRLPMSKQRSKSPRSPPQPSPHGYLEELQKQYKERIRDMGMERETEIKKKELRVDDSGESRVHHFPHFIESYTQEEKMQKCFEIYTTFLQKNHHALMRIIERMEEEDPPSYEID